MVDANRMALYAQNSTKVEQVDFGLELTSSSPVIIPNFISVIIFLEMNRWKS